MPRRSSCRRTAAAHSVGTHEVCFWRDSRLRLRWRPTGSETTGSETPSPFCSTVRALRTSFDQTACAKKPAIARARERRRAQRAQLRARWSGDARISTTVATQRRIEESRAAAEVAPAHLLSKRSCAPDCTGSSLHVVARRSAAAHERWCSSSTQSCEDARIARARRQRRHR